MILRVLTARAAAGQGHRLEKRAKELLAPDCVPDALLHGVLGRQYHVDGDTFVFMTVWPDLDTLYDWVGGKDLLDSANLLAGLEEWIDEVRVDHYHVAAWTESPGGARDGRVAAETALSRLGEGAGGPGVKA